VTDPDIPCVGAIVRHRDGRILVIQRGQPPAEGMWSLPGGRVEAGEGAEDAVVREIREETGLDVTVVREVGTVIREAPSGGRYVIRDFLVTPLTNEAPIAADDARDARFVTLEQLRALPTTDGLIDALHTWDQLPT
jgi:ADP-ribose pyrophosphatase YjhB (NUDIX family)